VIKNHCRSSAVQTLAHDTCRNKIAARSGPFSSHAWQPPTHPPHPRYTQPIFFANRKIQSPNCHGCRDWSSRTWCFCAGDPVTRITLPDRSERGCVSHMKYRCPCPVRGREDMNKRAARISNHAAISFDTIVYRDSSMVSGICLKRAPRH
jgi:hypothetical protein